MEKRHSASGPSVNRRDFLRRTGVSAVGAVSAALPATGAPATGAPATGAPATGAAEPLRRLGRTGLMVSAVAFGAGGLNPSRRDLVPAALDAGITLFDTSPAYGEGASETTLGQVLGGSAQAGGPLAGSRRDRVVLMTKEPGLDHAFLATQPDAVAERALAASVEGSLRRLRTDRIDVLFCPASAENPAQAAYPQLRQALERLRDAGKVRFFGLATDDGGHAAPGSGPGSGSGYASVARAAVESGFYDVVMTVLNAATLDGEGTFRRLVNDQQAARNRRTPAPARGRRPEPPAPAAEDLSWLPELAAAADVGLVAMRAAHTRFLPPESDAAVLRRFARPGLSRHQCLYRTVLDRIVPDSTVLDGVMPPMSPGVASVAVGLHTPEHLREAAALLRGR
jgi:hypothetical protein